MVRRDDSIFYTTPVDADGLGKQYRLEDASGVQMVIQEHIDTEALRSRAPLVTQPRQWTVEEFQAADVCPTAQAKLRERLKANNAHRT